MASSYERKGFFELFGRHEIKKAAQGGLAGVRAFSNPVNGHANHRPADHRQVERAGAMADAAAVFSGDHVQPQVQARFDGPMPAVSLEHLLRAQHGRRTGAEQVFSFDALGRMASAVDAAGQSGGLRHKGEVDGGGGGSESPQAARLGAAAIELARLRDGRLVFRGKKRAPDFGKAVARWRRRLFGCL